jgi:hypothetical protein
VFHLLPGNISDREFAILSLLTQRSRTQFYTICLLRPSGFNPQIPTRIKELQLHPVAVLLSMRFRFRGATENHRAAVNRGVSVFGGDMIATFECVLYWLVSGVAAAFIGLAVVTPQQVDRTILDILTRIVTAVARN